MVFVIGAGRMFVGRRRHRIASNKMLLSANLKISHTVLTSDVESEYHW